MSQIFETILSMSIGASVLAVLVLAARAIIGRRQTVVLTILFAMLIAKLVVPLSIESRISIFNILPEAVAQSAQIDTIGTPIEDDAVIAAISDEGTSAAEQGGTVAQADADEETAAVLVPETNTNGAADVVPAPNGADAVAMLDTYANEAVLGDGTAIVQAQLNANTAEVSTDTSGRAPPKAPMSAIDILAIVWLAGIAVMVSIIAASNIAFMRKVRRNRAYTSPGFDEMLSQCADDLRIRQKIGAVRMSDINTVAVCGIFRPKLLISPQVFDALGEQEKRHVIMHELGHIKRKDTLVCLILTIVNVLHWFNPLVWIAFVLFRKDLEIMCDSKVLRGLPRAERSRYANTLLTLVGKTGTKRNRLAMAMFMSKAGIKRRIAMIAKYKRNKPIVVALALILAVGIAITGCTVGTTDISKIGEWEAVEIGDLELLASHTIDYSDYVGDKARVHNIKKAAELLNGIRIGPDEQVDLLYTIGPITTENGWRNASGVSWETVILLLGHEDTENETTLGADPHTVQTGGGVGLVATAYCIVGVNARMDQVISGDMEGLITQGDAGLHNWFDIDVVFETIEDGDTIIVNLYGPGNFDEQMERLQAENREGIVDRETSTEFLTVYTFGKLSVDLSFCADDENILSNIVKTMDELEGKVFSPGKPETLMSSEIYEEDGWETAPARSWQDIGGLEPENIGYIENLETQLQRGGGSEIVLAAVKGAAIEAGLSVTSLDPSEAVLNEFTEDVKLFLMMRDNTLHAVFTSEESPEQTKGDLYVFYGEDVTVGNLRIIADTQVVAPERDKVVAFNVKAANFTQEQVDGLIEAFFDGESVYELELGPVMTKAQVKEILDMWKQRKAATSGEWATEENQAWCDEVIERWEQKYLTAPEVNNAVVSDGQLKPRDLMDSETGEKIATYSELIVFTGAENDHETGMRIRSNNDLKEAISHAEGYGISLERNAMVTYSRNDDYDDNYWMSEPIPVTQDSVITDENVLEKLKMTPRQAQEMAQSTLRAAGIDYMELYSMSLVDNANNGSVDGEVTSATNYAYRLQFTRTVYGIPCVYREGGTGFTEFWAYETLNVFIDDRGVFSFVWSSPLEVNEQALIVTDMLSLDDIISKFEETMQAKYGAIESVQTTIKVERVELELIRVAMNGSVENGMLIPVWNFYGTKTIGNDNAQSSPEDAGTPISLLIVNAMDGSIITQHTGN